MRQCDAPMGLVGAHCPSAHIRAAAALVPCLPDAEQLGLVMSWLMLNALTDVLARFVMQQARIAQSAPKQKRVIHNKFHNIIRICNLACACQPHLHFSTLMQVQTSASSQCSAQAKWVQQAACWRSRPLGQPFTSPHRTSAGSTRPLHMCSQQGRRNWSPVSQGPMHWRRSTGVHQAALLAFDVLL